MVVVRCVEVGLLEVVYFVDEGLQDFDEWDYGEVFWVYCDFVCGLFFVVVEFGCGEVVVGVFFVLEGEQVVWQLIIE